MNLDAITAWIWENKEAIGLFAVVTTAVGSIYQPTRDLLKVLPKITWGIVKYTVLTAWTIIWPIRILIKWTYTKFAAKRVEIFFNNLFEWFEKREAINEERHKNKNTIEATDL